jgi:prepilin-type N-terminal cleavage/methylation domain-containing protein
MFMKKNHRNSGFTLTEILVAITVFAFITMTIYSVYQLSQKAFRETEKLAEIAQNGRVILERMIREIRQTKVIITELPSNDSITFEDGHISEPYHYIHYYREDSNVEREVIGYYFSGDPETLVSWDAVPPEGQTLETKTIEEPRIIGEYAISLSFSGLRVISISISLEKQNKSIGLKSQVFGRNL